MGQWAQAFAAVAATVLAMMIVAPSRAQDCPDFTHAAGAGLQQYRQLRVTRGSPDPVAPRPVPNDLRGRIGTYLQWSSIPGETRPNGLLVYHRDGDAVCGYLWRSDEIDMGGSSEEGGRYLTFRLPISSAGDLAALIENARIGLSSGAVTAERAPHRREETLARGATTLQTQPTSEDRAREMAGRLAEVLFSGITNRIEDLGNLSIVPALNIGTVPFGALDPDEDGVPMVASVSVNIEESLGDVIDGRLYAIRPEFRPQAIAGDPDATHDKEWIFPRLPGAADEARAVARRFGTEPVLGAQATIAEVSGRMAGSAYLHIAAHGLSDPTNPIDGSFLALSDGRLTARSIQEMKLLRNPLVVLSACQTGLGGALDAGIIGLARAFMLAGASSVVSSLWNVDDDATAWIMTRFLANLDTAPPAEALRRAQDEARHRWPHPSIWSSFMLFGSRSVVLDQQDVGSKTNTGKLVQTVHRKRGDELVDLAGGEPFLVADGDELHVTVANNAAEPLRVDFLYAGLGEETATLDWTMLAAGTIAQVPLARMTETGLDRAALLTVVRETDAIREPVQAMDELDGASALLTLRNLVAARAIPTLFPEGIEPLGGFGMPEAGIGVELSKIYGRGELFATPIRLDPNR